MSFFTPQNFEVTNNLHVGHRLDVGHHTHIKGHLSVYEYIRTYKDIMVDGNIEVGTDVNVGRNLTVSQLTTLEGPTLVSDNTESTECTNGAFVVTGGVGIGDDLNVCADVNVGADLNVTGSTTLEGTALITNTTDSTLYSNGALVVSGGVGIQKNLRTNANIFAGGKLYQESYLILPPGTVIPYAGGSSPTGFLLCDGASVSRTTYSDLFAIIATTYGAGNGSTTFTLPDLRQRMIYGVSGSNALGTTGGSATRTLTTNELPAHTHTGTALTAGSHNHGVSDPGHTHSVGIGRDDGNVSSTHGQYPPGDSNSADYYISSASSATGVSIQVSGDHTHTLSINSTGSGNSFSIINPYLSLNFIIKY